MYGLCVSRGRVVRPDYINHHARLQALFEVQALGNFNGEEEGDLGFKEREILTILESRYIATNGHVCIIILQ